ncbi:MAG: hypothetical protein ACI8RD_000620 [Bacillariaceae sp.]|jgi:hypothetical protein
MTVLIYYSTKISLETTIPSQPSSAGDLCITDSKQDIGN